MNLSVEKKYAGDDRVVFLRIQTVWERFGVNTFEAGKEDLAKWGLGGIYGFDPGDLATNTYPDTILDYRTGGTPWNIVIDKEGKVVLNETTTTIDRLVEAIDESLGEEGR